MLTAHLATALSSYFEREGRRVVFKNGMSLNQLALSMWERLGFREIDASVVSRVLKGERLFTPSQLEIFCTLLSISKPDRQYLFYCLHLDQCAQFGVKLPESFFSDEDVHDFLHEIVLDTNSLVFKGKFQDILRVSSLLVTHIRALLSRTHDNARRKYLLDLLGTSLYLKGRALGGLVLPLDALPSLLPIYQELISIASETRSKLMYAYAYTTYSSAYLIRAADSFLSQYRLYHLESIRVGKKAFSTFSDEAQDKFLALWTLVSSYIYLRDKRSFLSVSRDQSIRKFISNAKPNNLVQGTHIYHIIARGEAFFGETSADNTFQIPFNKYGNVMRGMRIQEVADIRTELETFLLLKTKGVRYLRSRLQRGLEIATEEGSVRLIQNLKDIEERL